jgi:hypothetical protein
MVDLGERFEPDQARRNIYLERYERYRALWPLMKDYLRAGHRLAEATASRG